MQMYVGVSKRDKITLTNENSDTKTQHLYEKRRWCLQLIRRKLIYIFSK